MWLKSNKTGGAAHKNLKICQNRKVKSVSTWFCKITRWQRVLKKHLVQLEVCSKFPPAPDRDEVALSEDTVALHQQRESKHRKWSKQKLMSITRHTGLIQDDTGWIKLFLMCFAHVSHTKLHYSETKRQSLCFGTISTWLEKLVVWEKCIDWPLPLCNPNRRYPLAPMSQNSIDFYKEIVLFQSVVLFITISIALLLSL